jgi:iron complex outermembrane receptor protein
MSLSFSRPSINRTNRLVSMVSAAALVLSSPAIAAEFNIPGGKLDAALQQLANESGLQIVYASDVVADRPSAPVAGKYTDREALAVMLSKSKLVADQRSPNGIIFIHQQVADASDTTTKSKPTTPAASATPSEPPGSIEPIIVTAQRRREDLQHVPVTIKAIDARTIDALHVQNLVDLAQLVPGLAYSTGAGQSQPTLRGFTQASSGPWQEPTVSTFIDGVYYISGNVADAPLNNVARVEVDKGPQGTLFGRNSVGGVISIETKDPKQDPSMDVTVGYGNYNSSSGTFYGTTGITNNLAADLAITGENQGEGWGRNLYDGSPLHNGYNYSARSKWLWKPSDATKFTLIGDWGRVDTPGDGLDASRGVFPFITTGPFHNGGFYDSYTNSRPYFQIIQWGTSLKAEHDFGWSQFVSITAARRESFALNPVQEVNPPFLPATPAVGQLNSNKIYAHAIIFDRMESQEFQLLSPESSSIKWVAGTYFLFDTSGFDPNYFTVTTAPKGATTTSASTGQTLHSYSTFAQATTPTFADTRLTAGFRFTSDERDVWGSVIRNTAAAPGVFTIVPALGSGVNPEPSHTWDKATYKAILEHDLADNMLTYFSFATGFQSAFYTISASANAPPTAPVKVDAYEVGLKTNLFDNRVRFNTSLFLDNIDNIVVTRVVNNVGTQSNAAAGQIKGIDFDLTVKPIQNLTLNAGIQYLSARYTNYSDAVALVPNGTGTYASVAFNAAGFPIQYSEKFMGTTAANYVIPTDAGNFSLDGSVTYHSGTYFDVQGLNLQLPYALVNASVTWTAQNGRQDLKLWSQNLTNKEYAGGLLASNVLMMYTPAPPRMFGIRFGYHWK